MFITIDTFRFVPPTGFTDVTGYSFRERGAKELLDVSAGVLPAGIDTLDALLAERRSELELGLPGSIQIDGEGATALAGLPARTLAFSFSDGGERIREHWVLVLDTVNAPPEWKHKGATRVHRAEGDGTVPGPSANPLTPNVAVSGVEHSAACSDVNVQRRIRKWIEELLS